jgi:hypothetical protein
VGAYRLPNGAAEYADKPDVLLKGERTIGIEITRFYLQPGWSPGSEQQQNSTRHRSSFPGRTAEAVELRPEILVLQPAASLRVSFHEMQFSLYRDPAGEFAGPGQFRCSVENVSMPVVIGVSLRSHVTWLGMISRAAAWRVRSARRNRLRQFRTMPTAAIGSYRRRPARAISGHVVEPFRQRVVEAMGERKSADGIPTQLTAFRAGDGDLLKLADQVTEGRKAIAGHGVI